MQEVERLCDSVVVVARGRTVATGTIGDLLAATGQTDFEEAFVKLAFGPERALGHDERLPRIDPDDGNEGRVDLRRDSRGAR
jgi:ABC-type multidrug transport system ATPase subunit